MHQKISVVFLNIIIVHQWLNCFGGYYDLEGSMQQVLFASIEPTWHCLNKILKYVVKFHSMPDILVWEVLKINRERKFTPTKDAGGGK